ncbi:MAG: hypothetical protein Q8R79_07100 [Legionellaceae bacterium]|nr:hypothetical protein [Legionellaceae bacterium]
MNGFMRGNIHPYYGVYTPIRDVLLHSVMCASGLSKLPETNIQESHRYENLFDLNEHRNRIRAATEKGVISLSGFVSTTVDGCEILSSQITPTMDNLKTFHLKYGTAYIVTPHKIFYISKSTHNSNATIKSLKVSSTHRNNLNKNIKPNERRTLTHDELNQMWQYTALHHKELYKPYSNVHFTFKNLRGKYIAPLSMFSYENEFLVSPTDVQIEQFHQSGERSYFTCSPVRPLDAQNVRKTFTLQEQDTLQDLEDYLHQQITALTPPSEKLVAFKDCLKKVTALKKNPTSNKAYTKKIIALTEKIKNIDKKAFQTVSGDIFSFVIELLKQEKIVLSKEESDTLQNNTELQQAIIIFVLSCHKLHHDKLSTSKKNALKQYQIDTIKLSLKGADAFINGYACLQNKVLSSIHDNAIVRGIRQFFYLLLIPFTSMKLNTIHTLLDVCSRDDLQQRLIVAQQKINLSIFKTKKSESPPSAPPKPPLTHK